MALEELPLSLSDIQFRVDQVIMSRQNNDTGLFPASTALTEHGDYSDAWVRDNLYSIVSVFGLWQHFQQQPNQAEQAEKYASVTRNMMRGLLKSMMAQAAKVEKFKVTQHPMDALHAKYDTATGLVVVADDQWGHLQIDATSLFLLTLGQMAQAGLAIINAGVESHFVQNLVYYIGKGYQIPDFGIWERGNKSNNGSRELHASSIGMVKSALLAVKAATVPLLDSVATIRFYVNDDEIARCRMALEQLLPRESLSKEVDAACLSITGYPAFSVEDADLVARTEEKIRKNLMGPYGSKRFLLDGHQTPLEDKYRLHYNDQELKNFQDIECEWPLFFVYHYVTALIRQQPEIANSYRERITNILVRQGDFDLIPELYRLQADQLPAERKKPGSQKRSPNENLPLVWAQSLYYFGLLIEGGWLTPQDADPLGLRKRNKTLATAPIQMVLLAADEQVQSVLATRGFSSETALNVAPAIPLPSDTYAQIHAEIGACAELGLSGAPLTRPRALERAKVFRVNNIDCVFVPAMQNQPFYFVADSAMLADNTRAELAYLARHWRSTAPPLSVFWITQSMLQGDASEALFQLLEEVQQGTCNGVRIAFSSLSAAIASGDIEHRDCPHFEVMHQGLSVSDDVTWRLRFDAKATEILPDSLLHFLEPIPSDSALLLELLTTENLYKQLEILLQLLVMHDMQHVVVIEKRLVSLSALVAELYERGCVNGVWSIVRKTASLLGLYYDGLEDAVADILARQKILFAGRSYDAVGQMSHPLKNADIVEVLKKNTGYDERETMVNQEIIVFLAMLLRDNPKIFSDTLTLRSGQILQLMTSNLSQHYDLAPPEAFDRLCALSPSELLLLVKKVITNFEPSIDNLLLTEGLRVRKNQQFPDAQLTDVLRNEKTESLLGEASDWYQWREMEGLMPRLQVHYYTGLWHLLERCQGLVLGNRFDRKTRMTSEIVLSSMTHGEGQFEHLFEKMLSRIASPSYRQMTIEALYGMMQFLVWHPEISLKGYLIVEVVLGYAVKINWLKHHPTNEEHYNDVRGKAWRQFYLETPETVMERVGDAIVFLIASGQTNIDDDEDAASVHKSDIDA